MRKILCILALSLIVFSCVDKPKSTIEEIQLTSIALDNPDELPMMKVPFRVGVSGSRLVMLDLVADSCFYHVLDYPSLKHLYSVGPKGQGRDEIMLSTPFQINKDRLYVYDGIKGTVFVYDLQDGKYINRIETDAKRGIDFVCKNDSVFYMEDMSGKSRIIEWTPVGSKSYFNIPEQEAENNAKKAYLWRSYMAYNSDLRRLALATQHGGVLELYDMDKHEVIKIIAENDELYPTDMNEQRGYCDIQWVDDDLYALYSNETSIERKKENIKEQGGNILKVFDKNGLLKKQYKLDAYIHGFTMDKANHRLIGITPNSDYPICFWNLP